MELSPGTPVRSVDNPSRQGTITNRPPRQRASGTHFQVRWADGTIDFVHEEELDKLETNEPLHPVDLVEQGRFGRSGDLRRNLTYVHLSGRLANLVYAMGITNTDFYPHQYRPLLTLLDSPVNGLLIADEVGLGKTIEAGLIWTELRARFDMRRLLIVCPAVLREKWRDELRNRFGIDATISDAAFLMDALKQPRREVGDGKAWIISYQSARPPRGWRPNSSAAKSDSKSARSQLAALLAEHQEDEPLIDMAVFDEAHYMRNRDSAAWHLGELLQGVSDYLLMLSATPINLKSRDLFNLLNLLDPDHFSSEQDFTHLIEANRPLIAARDAALNLKSTADDVLEHLGEAKYDPFIGSSRLLAQVLKDPPTDARLKEKAYRAELADTIERMSLLSHAITRTRKRDVQEQRVSRRVRREAVEMNGAELELYQLVTEKTREYAWKKNINDGFLLATPQRQVASCPAAVVEAWLAGGREREELLEDLETQYEDDMEVAEQDEPTAPLRELLTRAIPGVVDPEALRRHDSKFSRLLTVMGQHLDDNPREKIVVFTSFRTTARYVAKRLSREGFRARLLWGGQAQNKQEIINEFKKSSKDRVLVSTEVSAEGVDLQFCRVLVNYDLPWNPTRIEQRIGRIDRLGQQADVIHIWNLHFANTIDERIVSRLLVRLDIFTRALGEAEEVVGKEIRRLESTLLKQRLTPEQQEEEIERSAQAIENARLQQEELERNAAHMMAHGQRVMERIEAARELARRVTEKDLFVYVQDYLREYWPGHQFSQYGNDPFKVSIRLPAELAARLDEFIRQEGLQQRTLLATGEVRKCHFLNQISESGRGTEIMHQFHPLVRYISRDLKTRRANFYPLVGIKLRVQPEWRHLPEGKYVFFVNSWTFNGVRDEQYLAVSATDLNSGNVIDPDIADQMLQLARLHGSDWIGVENEIDRTLTCDRLDRAEDALRQRYKNTRERMGNENADRARFQLDSIERYLERRILTMRRILKGHEAAGRQSLAKATQGKIEKLRNRMNIRREMIQEKQKVKPEKHFVCAGIINLMH